MKLRPYQENAIRALWKSLKQNPHGSPLIVAPTGSGKSLLIAEICRKVLQDRPEYHVLCVSHRKEIIDQNARELQSLLPELQIGIYSAGLGVKRIRKITFANIQSIFKKVKALPVINLLLIDECHLLSRDSNSMYRKLIDELKIKNINLKIVGLTATPFRLDQGSLINDDSIFTEIAYDISIRELISQGYLSPLVSMPKESRIDLQNIRTSGYDYNQTELEDAYRGEGIIREHAKEIIKAASDRESILIFTAGIKHAKEISDELNRLGYPSSYVTGEMLPMERDKKIGEFTQKKIKALCNCEILTTGFNYRNIDCIVLLRATKSCALYVQAVGRGTRIAEGKKDCLVLDFGGNIKRHGPIDLVEVKSKKKNKAEIGSAPSKDCPDCGCVVSIKVLACPNCGYEFPISTTTEPRASTESILSEIEEFDVTDWNVKIHQKAGKPPSLRVSYNHGKFLELNDFLCFEHGGYASSMAGKKWIQLGGELPVPKTAKEGLERSAELLTPIALKAIKNGKYYQVLFVLTKKREEEPEVLLAEHNF